MADDAHRAILQLEQANGGLRRFHGPLVGDLLEILPHQLPVRLLAHRSDHHQAPATEIVGHRLVHFVTDPAPLRRVAEPFGRCIPATFPRPRREKTQEACGVGGIGIGVGQHLNAGRPGRRDQIEGRALIRPVARSGGLEVGDFDPRTRLSSGLDGLVDRPEQAAFFVPDVRSVEPVAPSHHRRQKDDLIGGSEQSRHVPEAGGETEGAVIQSLDQLAGHELPLILGRLTVLEPDGGTAEAALADEQGLIQRDAQLFDGLEVARHALPRELGFIVRRQLLGRQLFRRAPDRRDRRSAVAGDLGGDAVVHTARRCRIAEDAPVGVAMDVDEPGAHHLSSRIDGGRGLLGRDRADGPNGVPHDSQICSPGRATCAVQDGPVADHQIKSGLRLDPRCGEQRETHCS